MSELQDLKLIRTNDLRFSTDTCFRQGKNLFLFVSIFPPVDKKNIFCSTHAPTILSNLLSTYIQRVFVRFVGEKTSISLYPNEETGNTRTRFIREFILREKSEEEAEEMHLKTFFSSLFYYREDLLNDHGMVWCPKTASISGKTATEQIFNKHFNARESFLDTDGFHRDLIDHQLKIKEYTDKINDIPESSRRIGDWVLERCHTDRARSSTSFWFRDRDKTLHFKLYEDQVFSDDPICSIMNAINNSIMVKSFPVAIFEKGGFSIVLSTHSQEQDFLRWALYKDTPHLDNLKVSIIFNRFIPMSEQIHYGVYSYTSEGFRGHFEGNEKDIMKEIFDSSFDSTMFDLDWETFLFMIDMAGL